MSVSDGGALGENDTLGRAKYSILVEPAGGRWFASWRCLACSELTGATLRGDTIEEALARAANRVDDHHGRVHASG